MLKPYEIIRVSDEVASAIVFILLCDSDRLRVHFGQVFGQVRECFILKIA